MFCLKVIVEVWGTGINPVIKQMLFKIY